MIYSPRPFFAFVVATALIAVGSLYAFSPGVSAEESPGEGDFGEMPAADNVVVVYQGTLQNAGGEPVSGVFPLTFHLYRGSMSASPLWSERHFVSVVDGRYQLALGHDSPLREHLLQGERWLGIALDGEDEILRDRLSVDRPDGDERDDEAAGSRVSHADVAERATEAERARLAENALALDGMTAQEIEDKAELAIQRLGEHIADPDAHRAVMGPTVGGSYRTMDESAGGTGGSPFDIRCPDDHVVTGITGGAGRVVDNVTVICSPLE